MITREELIEKVGQEPRRSSAWRSELPTQETLCALLEYEHDTGALTWKRRPVDMFRSERHAGSWNTRWAGTPALASRDRCGYLMGTIFAQKVWSHRAIWKLVHGVDADEIDHINGHRDDNRIANLREVTRVENLRNLARRVDNKSGVTGVSWVTGAKRWCSHIKTNGIRRHLGYFTNIDDAISARRAAERDLGFHANHGRVALPKTPGEREWLK